MLKIASIGFQHSNFQPLCCEMLPTQNDFEFLDLTIQCSPTSSRKRTKSLINPEQSNRMEEICELLTPATQDEERSRSKSPLGKSDENRPAPGFMRQTRRTSNPCRIVSLVNTVEMKRRSVALLNIDESARIKSSTETTAEVENAPENPKSNYSHIPPCLFDDSNIQLPAPLTKQVRQPRTPYFFSNA
jgi:hypothetical protein